MCPYHCGDLCDCPMSNKIFKYCPTHHIMSCYITYMHHIPCCITYIHTYIKLPHIASYCIRYRHTLDELRTLMSAAQQKANLFYLWSKKVDRVLDGYIQPKPSIESLKQLLTEGEGKGLTACEQYNELSSTIEEANKISSMIEGVVYRKG